MSDDTNDGQQKRIEELEAEIEALREDHDELREAFELLVGTKRTDFDIKEYEMWMVERDDIEGLAFEYMTPAMQNVCMYGHWPHISDLASSAEFRHQQINQTFVGNTNWISETWSDFHDFRDAFKPLFERGNDE